MKGGWPPLGQDLETYLKTGGVVVFLEFDVDFFEDFFFPSIWVIIGREISPTSVGSHYSTFFLSFDFLVEGIIIGRTSYIASSSMKKLASTKQD